VATAARKEQLEVAQALFDRKAYALALKAARRVVVLWPTSDFAPQAQYLTAAAMKPMASWRRRSRSIRSSWRNSQVWGSGRGSKAPIRDCNLYLAGRWFKLWGYIPYRSMERTARMYAEIVKTGPYSDIAPRRS